MVNLRERALLYMFNTNVFFLIFKQYFVKKIINEN